MLFATMAKRPLALPVARSTMALPCGGLSPSVTFGDRDYRRDELELEAIKHRIERCRAFA